MSDATNKVDKGKGKAGELGLADLIVSGGSSLHAAGFVHVADHSLPTRRIAMGREVPTCDPRRRRGAQGHHLDE